MKLFFVSADNISVTLGIDLFLYHNDLLYETNRANWRLQIRAVAGQRSSPDLYFATKFIKMYDP